MKKEKKLFFNYIIESSFSQSAAEEEPIMRLISSSVWSFTKLSEALKYYDVKQLYFQNEFENLESLSPQNKMTGIHSFRIIYKQIQCSFIQYMFMRFFEQVLENSRSRLHACFKLFNYCLSFCIKIFRIVIRGEMFDENSFGNTGNFLVEVASVFVFGE